MLRGMSLRIVCAWALAQLACASQPSSTSLPDATVVPDVQGVAVDAPRMDASMEAAQDVASSLDAASLDAASLDAQDAGDVVRYDPCGTIRDLNALGTRDGEITRVSSDNLAAGRVTSLVAPCAGGMTGYPVVYRYVPRRTTRLRISTNDVGTDARFDTVVFALSSCAPVGDGGSASLGCSDDTGDPPRDHATTFVTDVNVTAGVPMYIVVSGFLHATAELWDSQGRFALAVTEQ